MLSLYWVPMAVTLGCCIFLWPRSHEVEKDALLWLTFGSTVPVANIVAMVIAMTLVLITISMDRG